MPRPRKPVADDWNSYIGRPYIKGARGPDAFNCWGLVVYVGRRHYGLPIPDHQVEHDDRARILELVALERESDRWRALEAEARLKAGDVVLFGRPDHQTHAGIYVGEGVLHAERRAGVCLTPLSELGRISPQRSWYRCSPKR